MRYVASFGRPFLLALTAGIQLLASNLPAMSPGHSLREAFLASVQRSATIDIQKEMLTQSVEVRRQALGGFLPTITGAGNYTHQELPNSTGNPLFLADSRTAKVTGDLPLFRGFKDFATLRQSTLSRDAQALNLKNAAKQLFYDLSTAYYNVLVYQSDAKNYRDEIEVNRRRLSELRGFLRIGRSRPTELLTFQANISSLEAQLAVSLGQAESAKDVLAFFTGWDRETTIADDESCFDPPAIAKSLEALERRPDVQAALATAKASLEGVPIARAGHLPSLDLVGDNYFLRPGQPDGPDWDVQLVLSIPIFQGGNVQSQIRQAQSVAHQYDLVLTQARRTAEQEIRTFHDAFAADRKQLEKLEETLGWSKKNFTAQQHDYRNGLVTNLDVLTSITAYQDAQRLLDRQRLLTQLDGVKLQAATAKRSEIDVSYR